MEKNLAEQIEQQKNDFLLLDEKLKLESRVPLRWNHAWRRMQSDNLGLAQSRKQLEDSKKLTKQQWFSLVPRLSAFVGVGDSITQLSRLDGEVNARLIANFTIPNPAEFYASLYSIALQQQNAVWSHELDKRRAYAQLYRQFLEAQDLQEAEQQLQNDKRMLASANAADLQKHLRSIVSREENLRKRRTMHRLSVNQVLNTPGDNWDLIGSLPPITYRNQFRQLKPGERFGKLALNLQAIQIEGALLNTYRVRFQQWPNITFGLSSPPLYTNSGENASFSADEFNFFSGANKTFDYSDLLGRRRIEDTRQRLEFTRSQLRQRLEQEILKINDAKSLYAALLREERQLQKELGQQSEPSSPEIETMLQFIEARNSKKTRLHEIEKQMEQLDLQFILWDEHYWNH